MLFIIVSPCFIILDITLAHYDDLNLSVSVVAILRTSAASAAWNIFEGILLLQRYGILAMEKGSSHSYHKDLGKTLPCNFYVKIQKNV